MKPVHSLLLFVAGIVMVQAQESPPAQISEMLELWSYDTIPEEEVRINNLIDYHTTSLELMELLGEPSDKGTEYWEMNETTVDTYHYQGADFFFLDGRMESFKLNSRNWYIQTSRMQLKVGNSIYFMKDHYSGPYSRRKDGRLSIPIGEGDYKFLLIHYNSGNIITSIEQRIYWR